MTFMMIMALLLKRDDLDNSGFVAFGFMAINLQKVLRSFMTILTLL